MDNLILTGNVKNRSIIENALQEQLDIDALIALYEYSGKDAKIYVSYKGENRKMDVYIGNTRSNRKKIGTMKTIENQLRGTICECPSILALEGKICDLAKELLTEDDFKEEYSKSKTNLENKGHINRTETFKIAKYEKPDLYEYMLENGTPSITKMLKMGILERETGKSLRFIVNYDNKIEDILGEGINTKVYSPGRFKYFFYLFLENWNNLRINRSNLLDIIQDQFGFEVSKPYTYRVTTNTFEVYDLVDVNAIIDMTELQKAFRKIESYMTARTMMGFSNDEYEKKYGKTIDHTINMLKEVFCTKKKKKRHKTC